MAPPLADRSPTGYGVSSFEQLRKNRNHMRTGRGMSSMIIRELGTKRGTKQRRTRGRLGFAVQRGRSPALLVFSAITWISQRKYSTKKKAYGMWIKHFSKNYEHVTKRTSESPARRPRAAFRTLSSASRQMDLVWRLRLLRRCTPRALRSMHTPLTFTTAFAARARRHLVLSSSANLANQDLLVLGEILVLQHLVQLAERHLGDFARRQRQSISRRQLLVLRLTSTTSRHALNAARRQRAIVAIRSANCSRVHRRRLVHVSRR